MNVYHVLVAFAALRAWRSTGSAPSPPPNAARRARRRHRIHPAAGRQLPPARRAAEGARLLADAGVDRDRSDHLRPAVALRPARRSGCSKEIMAQPAGVPPRRSRRSASYALLFWANRGNHNENTAQKFLPAFTFDELQAGGARRRRRTAASRRAYADLPALATRRRGQEGARPICSASIFDPAFEPMTTAKTPPPGKDILQASSNTFYQGVTLADLEERSRSSIR